MMNGRQHAPDQKPPSVLIATPAFAQNVNTFHAQSVIDATHVLNQYGVPWSRATLGNDSDIVRARNTIVASFLASPAYTHLMWIDGDVAFPADAVVRLLSHRESIVGAAYPKKEEPPKYVIYTGVRDNEQWPFKLSPAGVPIFQIKLMGTGFMCVHRHVFLRLMDHPEALLWKCNFPGHVNLDPEVKARVNRFSYTFFNNSIDRDGKYLPAGSYLTEDYTFCARAMDVGFDIWLDPDIVLDHIGTHVFAGHKVTESEVVPVHESEQRDASGAKAPDRRSET